MTPPPLYRGLWPQNISRLAKYAVRSVQGEWKVTVTYDVGDGLRFLAVEGSGDNDVAAGVNAVKTALRDQPGGAFYVNEFRHVLVPIAAGGTSHYYFAGVLEGEFSFEFEGRALTTQALGEDGVPLQIGAHWVGPRPGIPYVLAAGGRDIYYETPALTDADPPAIRPNMTRKVQLSRVLNDRGRLDAAVAPVARIRGHQGGRFYVNEHGALFTPVDSGDGNGINYTYCGQIDPAAWFPAPPVPTPQRGRLRPDA